MPTNRSRKRGFVGEPNSSHNTKKQKNGNSGQLMPRAETEHFGRGMTDGTAPRRASDYHVNRRTTATVQIYVPGVSPQYITLTSDKPVHTFAYTIGRDVHTLQLKMGRDHTSSSASSSSSSSASSDSKQELLCATVWYEQSTLDADKKAERSVQQHHRAKLRQIVSARESAEAERLVLEHDEKLSDVNDLFKVGLEVRELTRHLNELYMKENLQYDRTTTTMMYEVHVGQPYRLAEVPGEPELFLCAGTIVEAEAAVMVPNVRKTVVQTPVSHDYDGKYHGEIKLKDNPHCVVYHKGRAYVACKNGVSVCDVDNKSVVFRWVIHGGGDAAGVVAYEQHLYIVNSEQCCIQVYGLDGTFQRRFSTTGSGPGESVEPQGLALSDGDNPQLYVSDRLNSRVQVFGLDGSYVGSFGWVPQDNERVFSPIGLAVDEGCVYVCDEANDCIRVFGLDGAPQRGWSTVGGDGDGKFEGAEGIMIHHELAYVSSRHGVQVYEKGTGKFVRSWGSQGNGPGQFNMPWGMASVNDDECLLVCDYVNRRVQFFT